MKFFCLGLCCWALIGISNVKGDDSLWTISEFAAEKGDQPFILDRHSVKILGYNQDEHRLFLYAEDSVFILDLAERRWENLGRLQLPTHPVKEGFWNPNTESLWLYGNGAGLVYELDPDAMRLVRHDRSMQHRNQFDAAAFMDEESGEIMLFGGYGYWLRKNYITIYKPEQREWYIQNERNDSPRPAPRNYAFGLYNSSDDELIIAGGRGSTDNLDDFNQKRINFYDVWSFSFAKERWSKRSVLKDSTFEFSNMLSSAYAQAVLDSSHAIFLLTKGAVSDSYFRDMAVMNTTNGHIKIHSEFTEEFHGNLRPVGVFSGERRVYLVVRKKNFTTNLDRFLIYEIVPDNSEALASAVDSRRITLSAGALSSDGDGGEGAYSSYIWGMALLLLIISNLGTYVYVRQKRKVRRDHQQFGYSQSHWKSSGLHADSKSQERGNRNGEERAELETTGGRHLLVKQNGVLMFDNEVLADFISAECIDLLNIFIRQAGSDSPFVKSEEIEESIFKHTSSYDYRRRLRNESLQKISLTFTNIAHKQEQWILRRKSPGDKRKTEYSLNLAVIKLTK